MIRPYWLIKFLLAPQKRYVLEIRIDQLQEGKNGTLGWGSRNVVWRISMGWAVVRLAKLDRFHVTLLNTLPCPPESMMKIMGWKCLHCTVNNVDLLRLVWLRYSRTIQSEMTHLLEGPKGSLHNYPVSNGRRTQYFLEITIKNLFAIKHSWTLKILLVVS